MGLNPSFVLFGRAIISVMPFVDKTKEVGTWSDKPMSDIPEIDFLFSDGTDFLFSNGQDFVFREVTLAGSWSDKSKV